MRTRAFAILFPVSLALFACGRSAPAPGPTLNLKAIGRQTTEVVWNQGKLDRLADFYADGVVRHVPERPDPIVGLEANKAYIQGLRGAFPDGRIELVRLLADDGWVAVHWVWSGTQPGPLPGLPATGKPLRLVGMSFIRIENGKAAEIWDVDDRLSMLEQLGVIKLPGAAS